MSSSGEIPRVFCPLLGDREVGKLNIVVRYCNHHFIGKLEYIPCVDDNFSSLFMLQGKPLNLTFGCALDYYNRSNSDDKAFLRGYIIKPDIIALCFSVDDRSSLENVRSKWIPVVNEKAPKTPFVLVGTKIDLRDGDKPCISEEEGRSFAADVGAVGYFECSAKTDTGVRQMFDNICEIALSDNKEPKKRNGKCIIM